MSRVVAYYRVSTEEQGRSGLGLDSQRSVVRQMAAARGWGLVKEFTEVESGTNCDRQALKMAMQLCKNVGGTLVVAKLDRLARDAKFLLGLADSGVPILFGDLPEMDLTTSAGRMQLTMMAGMAEFESRRISERTKAALSQAKERGVKLGGSRGAAGTSVGVEKAALANKAKADGRAAELADVVREAVAAGGGLREAAKRLNEMGVLTPSKRGVWQAVTVSRVLEKIG
jgi:DNA invertase Pin-like site-specific DNA recombinase